MNVNNVYRTDAYLMPSVKQQSQSRKEVTKTMYKYNMSCD